MTTAYNAIMPEMTPQTAHQRTRQWKRRVILALLLLAGGAVVNVALAWGIAYRAESRYNHYHMQFADEVAVYSPLYSMDLPTPQFREELSGFGARYEFLVATEADEHYEKWVDIRILIAHVGWPFAAMRSLWFLHEDETGTVREATLFERGIDVDDVHAPDPFPSCVGPAYWPPRFLPLRPIFPGFIINTLFYALILWLLFFAPFAVRRMMRRKRGLCEKCAYPIGISEVCTECGAAVHTTVARASRP